MKRSLFWLGCLCVLFWGGCSSETKKEKESVPPKVSNEEKVIKEKRLILKTTEGKEIIITPREKGVSIDGFENKAVLINFFTTWCPPCRAEIPHLNNLQEKYKETFVIISVILEENKSQEELLNFIKYNRINYIITNGPENFQLAQALGGVKTIPMMFLYDKNGNYSTHYVGAIPEEMMDVDIQKAL